MGGAARAVVALAVGAAALSACSRSTPTRDGLLPEPSARAPAQLASPAPSAPVTSSTPAASRPASVPPDALTFLAPPPDAELGAYLRTERLRANAEGRLLVLYAGASWCPPCVRFHAAAHGGRLDAALGRVRLVELDAERDAARLAALGYIFKNIPYFAEPSANGRPARVLAVVDTSPEAQQQIVTTLSQWLRDR